MTKIRVANKDVRKFKKITKDFCGFLKETMPGMYCNCGNVKLDESNFCKDCL